MDWQTGQRALDPLRLAEHLDGVLFIANPLDAEGLPDPYVLSIEAAAARSANERRPFTAGLYLGRHVEADVYAHLAPAEAVATQVAGGAAGLHVYGYSGLDDGAPVLVLVVAPAHGPDPVVEREVMIDVAGLAGVERVQVRERGSGGEGDCGSGWREVPLADTGERAASR